MNAFGKVVRSGVGRRRVQTLVMMLAVLMAVTSAVVAGSLLVASSAPFDHSFGRRHGAHLVAQIDDTRASGEQPAATGRLPGVTASAGPYRSALVGAVGPFGAAMPQSLDLVGRSTPGGAVDDLDLLSGRWPATPGEVALSTDSIGPAYPVGSTLRIAQDGPALTVVGIAKSVSQSADGWVLPAEVDALRAAGGTPVSQMLYRFASAGTTARVAADRQALQQALPEGALEGAQSWLDTRLAADQNTALFVPVMTVFGVLGLVMSVIIVASVVSGAVGAGVRRIGILKSLGFTPGQVVRAYVAQALIPAVIGTGLGVVLGNLLAVPMLGDAQQAYGTGSLAVSWRVDAAVAGAAVGVVSLAALVPALRAGRLRTVEAIAISRAPRAGRGQWAHRTVGRLPLPRPVTLGLASPFARPVRTLAMLLAVVFGTSAVTFAVGLTSSASAVSAATERKGAAVTVQTMLMAQGGGTAADPAKVLAAVQAQPGTAGWYGEATTTATVEGASGPVVVNAYQGDLGLSATEMISGHWLTGPGQLVVPTHFLDATRTRVGDTVTLVDHGVRIPVRIVGEAFDPRQGGMNISTDLATLAQAEPARQPHTYDVSLKSGTSTGAYVSGLNAVLQPLGAQADGNSGPQLSNGAAIFDSMAVLLTLMLVGVAGLGVLNSVLLDTRERVRDLGICKALGMSPRQTVLQVVTSVVGIGLVAGVVGVPAGAALHDWITPIVMHAAGTNTPPSVQDVYGTAELLLLGLGGVAIAVLGAMLPAGWAAKARTAAALRTE